MEPLSIIASIGHVFSHILTKALVFWKQWNLRSFIITSFTTQLFLIVVAPFRKQSSNGLIMIPISASYLLADWVALQAVGFIPKRPAEGADGDIISFWAQFLLVHLGGPDTITALALQDNDLWLRTGLHLGTQVYATLRILFIAASQSGLRYPTLLMFLAGVIKYSERVYALYCSQLSECDQEPDECAVLLQKYEPKDWDLGDPLKDPNTQHESKSPLRPNSKEVDPTNVEMVRHAYFFFNYYKGLYADRVFKVHEWQTSMGYFLRRTPAAAFKVLEMELNFAYEAFYTKMFIILNIYGLLFRLLILLLESASLVMWTCFTDKRHFRGGDTRITYCLLIGAVAVDVLALFRILFSYWSIAFLGEVPAFRTFCNWLLGFWDRTWGEHWSMEDASLLSLTYIRRMFFRRWSETISQFNLISFCLDKRSRRKWKKLMWAVDKLSVLLRKKHVKEKWFSDELRNTIFGELRPTMEDKHKPGLFEDILTGRDWAAWYKDLESDKGFGFPLSMENMEFDECLLTFHIATEICYQSEADATAAAPGGDKENGSKRWVKREFSKVISDYMLHLLIKQPKTMSSIAGSGKVRYRDTCAHLREVLQTREFWDLKAEKNRAVRHKKTCNYLLKCHDTINMDGMSESVLIKAVKVARELRKHLMGNREETWELTARLWVAVLFYAARHCKPSVHASRLREGGELLSLVWLLSVHFGLGQPFKIHKNSGHGV